MKKSSFLSLNWDDFGKGLLVAFITALITGLYNLLQSGASFDWITLKPVLIASVGAGVAYILKNLFSNSEGTFMTKEPLKYKK
jgi:hypothetical protein